MVLSYLGLRRAIGISGLLLPVLLGPGGWLLFGIPIQDDMSSYYHTVLRDVFVGTIFAIGIFLFCYRGHDWVENWTANFGCFSALGIALFPIDYASAPPVQHTTVGYLHTLSGGIFFVTLAFYSLIHFPRRTPDDDEPFEPDPRVPQQNLIYRTSGLIILSSTLGMGVYLFLLSPDLRELCDRWNVLFWLEWIAIWSFASAWLTKGRVLGTSIALGVLEYVENQLPPALRPSQIQQEMIERAAGKPVRRSQSSHRPIDTE